MGFWSAMLRRLQASSLYVWNEVEVEAQSNSGIDFIFSPPSPNLYSRLPDSYSTSTRSGYGSSDCRAWADTNEMAVGPMSAEQDGQALLLGLLEIGRTLPNGANSRGIYHIEACRTRNRSKSELDVSHISRRIGGDYYFVTSILLSQRQDPIVFNPESLLSRSHSEEEPY